MNRTKYFARFALGLVIVAALLVTALSLTSAQEPKVLRINLGPGDALFDPSLATDTTSHTFIEMFFVGLTPQDEVSAAVVEGMAESWEVSEDGLVYTFNLVEGVPWVRFDTEANEVVESTDESGNVRFVTAHDFVYGTLRTLDPATASDYAYIPAEWIAGADTYNSGEGTAEDVQIRAIDDYTLEVTMAKAAAFVPQILGMWTTRAQPQWAIEEFGDAWTLPGNFETYGNFVLQEYTPGDMAIVVKNPFWPGTPSHPVPVIDEIEVHFLDASAALASYEAGELDYIDEVPLPDMPRVKVDRPDELSIVQGDCTYYYGFNVEKAPVDNVHLRRALSLAIDREAVVTITAGGQIPAGFFSRPNFEASASQEDYPYPDFGVATDPERAKEELQAYFDETGTTLADLPPITLMYNTSEAHALIAQAIQQQWNETLGIDVQVSNQEWQVYLDTLDEDAPQVWRLGWCKDYLDPHNFLSDVFRSTSGNNHTNWGNAEFDAIVDEAAVLDDPQARQELYARAEHILTWEDAAMAPIYFYTNVSLGQTYLDRTFSATGVERFDKWNLP